MTTTMPTTQSYWLSGLPWASPGGRHLYPNLWLSTVSRLFNPLSPDLFPPSDDYDVSATHAAPLVSFRGRQWSIPVAASGQVSWPPVVSSSCPLTLARAGWGAKVLKTWPLAATQAGQRGP